LVFSRTRLDQVAVRVVAEDRPEQLREDAVECGLPGTSRPNQPSAGSSSTPS